MADSIIAPEDRPETFVTAVCCCCGEIYHAQKESKAAEQQICGRCGLNPKRKATA